MQCQPEQAKVSCHGRHAVMTLISRLPQSFKKQLRLAGCRNVALWRRYPAARNRRPLSSDQAASEQKGAHTWQTTSTPIPNRGDATTCANRLHNLATAIRSINHRMIQPGEAFSLSQHLGEPTQKNGYRVAPVFVAGEVRSDAGGDLCLIATNLYQLFLYSGCTILKRHNHSIDAYRAERFYKLGEDAAIAFSYKDLAIQNPFNRPLLLCICLRANDIQSRLLCSDPKPIQTIIRSQVLERHAPMGQQVVNAGWSMSTARFSRPISSGSWLQDYLSFSHYKPC